MKPNISSSKPSISSSKKSILSVIWKYRALYLMLLPGILYMIIFKYLPMYGVIIAFKKVDMFGNIWGGRWIGLQNFYKFFNSIYFFRVFGNTILISLYKIIIGFPLPIIVALLLNEIGNLRFKRTIQTISYLPHFLSWVVVAAFAVTLLSPESGIVNKLMVSAGFEPINFLGSEKYFRGVIVATDIWKDVGWGTILYLATLSGVSVELYEAAIVDGAGRLRQTWHITMPALKSTIIILLIFKIGAIMEAGFEQIFVMYSPLVYSVGDIIDTYVYREGLQNANYGYATAVGLFKAIINVIFIVSANRLAKKAGETGIW